MLYLILAILLALTILVIEMRALAREEKRMQKDLYLMKKNKQMRLANEYKQRSVKKDYTKF